MIDNNKYYSSIIIGNVRIDSVTMQQAVNTTLEMINNKGKYYITTPNLDFLYNASNDQHFMQILNSSSLNIPDGKPLILLSRVLGRPLKEKVSGADFFVEVCRKSVDKNISIFLLGSAPGVADKAKGNLEERFNGIDIVGARSPSFGFEKDEVESRELVEKINIVSPDILFVGVGSPKQELWIDKYLDQLDVKVAIGVGASFDFAAGNVKIPPPYIKKIGFAWLWRLTLEPKRLWKRYLVNNLPLFIKLVFKALFSNKSKTDNGFQEN
jgi:exopolysaccharide biosynthesis WecB/TagA/CpsF family protein